MGDSQAAWRERHASVSGHALNPLVREAEMLAAADQSRPESRSLDLKVS